MHDRHGVQLVRVACLAMRTRFEIALWGERPDSLRAVAEEALEEIRGLHVQLSAYDTGSDVYELNACAAERPVRVEPRLFALLKRAAELSERTGGAFDITVGPLLEAWGFAGGSGREADPDALAAACERVGQALVLLDERDCTVRYAREGVRIDLGAIGKGYALERAADIVREIEPAGALLHGGTSSVLAMGADPDGEPWRVAIAHPADPECAVCGVSLCDESLSVSAAHGKAFERDGRVLGHVLDPRAGAPAEGAELAAVVCPSPAEGDALSTALMVRGSAWLPGLCADWGARALVVEQGRVTTVGL